MSALREMNDLMGGADATGLQINELDLVVLLINPITLLDLSISCLFVTLPLVQAFDFARA